MAYSGRGTKRQKVSPVADLAMRRPLVVRLLGISDRTFSRLEAEGVFAAVRPGTGRRASVYDGAAVVGAYLRHREQKLTGSIDNPRDARDRSQAELNRLRLAKERRALLPREQVISDGQAYVAAVAAKLRVIPPRAMQVGIVSEERRAALEDLIEEAISEMARWSTALELLQAVDDGDDVEAEEA